MLHTCILSPFSSPTRGQQFEAIAAALQAEANAPTTLLLGNLSVPQAGTLDAVVLRPRSITILQLLPTSGRLTAPNLRTGPWYLDGAPLELPDDHYTPFTRFEQQRAALASWLGQHFAPEAANLQFISGLVVFGGPVRFGAELEAHMAAVPAASQFHLLPEPAQFTRRLARLATPEIDLTEPELEQLMEDVHLSAASDSVSSPPAGPGGMLRQQAGRLWRWLGAEDLDQLDRASSGYDIDLNARNQEKEALENLRSQMQQELQQQLSALTSREAEREQRITELQRQLQAAPVAPEAPDLQAQLAAEKREKAALEASMVTYRQELATRNAELGRKIQQLEDLISRLSTAPAPAAPASVPAPVTVEHPSPTSPKAPELPPAPATVAQSSLPPPVASQPAAPTARAQWGRPTSAVSGIAAWGRKWPLVWRRLKQHGTTALSALPPAQARWLKPGLLAGAGVILLGGILLRCSRTDAPATFTQQGQVGLLAADGDTLLPARYATIGKFEDGRAVVEQGGVSGFIQQDGTEVVAPAYDALYPYTDGYARARIGGLYTFLNADGQEFSTYYYAARDFAEGRAAVLDHRGWHYISGPDEPTNPVIFQEAYSFNQELARVKTGGQFTFISPAYLADTTEGTAPFGRYTSATDFDAQGRARVTQNGRTYWLNRQGEEVQQ